MTFLQRVVSLLLPLFFGIAVSGAILYFYLPVYVETTLLPAKAHEAGIEDFGAVVRRISFSGADLSEIRIGNPARPPVSIDSLRIDYSLFGLRNVHIERIVVSGLALTAVVRDGTIELDGLDWRKILASRQDAAPTRDQEPARPGPLPLSIGQVHVYDSAFFLKHAGRQYCLPFELDLSETERGRSYKCTLHLHPRGQHIEVSSAIDISEKDAKVEFGADALRLGAFADVIKDYLGLNAGGRAAIHGNVRLTMAPFGVDQFTLSSQMADLRLAYKNIVVENSRHENGADRPARLKFAGNSDRWQLSAGDFLLSSPGYARLSSLTSEIEYTAGKMKSAGTVHVLAGPYHDSRTGLLMPEPLSLAGQFTGSYGPEGAWSFSLAAKPDLENAKKDTHFSLRAAKFTTEPTGFNLSGEGRKQTGRVRYGLNLTDPRILLDKVEFAAPALVLHGEAELGETLAADFELGVTELRCAAGSATVRGDVLVSGRLKSESQEATAGSPFLITGEVGLKNFSISESTQNLQAAGIHGSLPFQWPFEDAARQGDFRIDNISWNGKSLGTLSTILRQKGAVFEITGKQANTLLSGAGLELGGEVDLSDSSGKLGELRFSLPSRTHFAVKLGDYLKEAKGISADGLAGLDGEIRLLPQGVSGSATLRLTDGRLVYRDKDLSVTGINGTLVFPSLPEMRSSPQQTLTFAALTLKDLSLTEGEVRYQIESPESILVEKSGCRWAGGHVYTYALRLNPGRRDYDITLFCDRLKLAAVLEEFGATGAAGEGTVNGRIPLVVANGKLSFGDGFLYSTPGDTGTIRVADSTTLTEGIPKNSPQFAQVDFAMEALKDFVYKWVKLDILSENDDLLLKMQLDGEPARPLPFRYDRNIGGFARIDVKTEKGILQPIRLDVNFRLPLNRILDYSKGINLLIDKIKQ